MAASISVVDKKTFVRWFLKNYQLKRRECVWILNYLLSNEKLLKHIRFVEEAHYCPRAMVMSTVESTGVPFRFYKGNVMTADAEKSFHDLRLHEEEDMYVQLNFPNIPPSAQYLAVLEENPYMPEYLHISEKDRIIAEEMLSNSLLVFQEEKLLEQIDEALDSGDKERFYELSNLLQALQQTAQQS
ncbi:MAG: ReoY family proteolytic degradation factor [Lysinibacillus sp.]